MQPRRSRIVLSWHEGEDAHSVWLASQCTECQGTGLVYSPAWRDWSDRVRALEAEGVSFTDAAERCKPEPDEPEELQCVECEGAGMVPTPQGQAILDLVHTFQTGELFRKIRGS